MNKGRVIVAMSGGVDSSVAALLLKRQGYDVIGVTMRLWGLEREGVSPANKRCCSVEDVEDARRVCNVIGAPHYFQNFEREFQTHVVDYFVQEYERGRTPHPCLACNDKIKFDFLLRRAMFLEADYIATGHYARIHRQGDEFKLLKGVDESKDQSYVLFTLKQRELARLLLPLGDYKKDEIRELAATGGLAVADKPDSQEICFIPDGDYRKFIQARSETTPGDFIDQEGNVVGQHQGIQFFTVGQRRRLGLNGNTGKPTFVTKIIPETNQIVLGSVKDLDEHNLWASRVTYVGGECPQSPMTITAKIRYKSTESSAVLNPRGDWAELRFDKAQRAVTPGQAVVFYRENEVLGGGIIERHAPLLQYVPED